MSKTWLLITVVLFFVGTSVSAKPKVPAPTPTLPTTSVTNVVAPSSSPTSVVLSTPSTPAPVATSVASAQNPTPTPAASPTPSTPTPTPATSSPLISLAPPADIASLNAKELLAANNAAVVQVATMYQHFGLFITIIVGMVGVIATLLSYVAWKSVRDFVTEWDKKIREKDAAVDAVIKRAGEAETMASKSAAQAQTYADTLKTSLVVLEKALLNVDAIQPRTELLEQRIKALEIQRQGMTSDSTPSPNTQAASVTEPTAGESIDEPISSTETDSVDALLRNRLPSVPPST